MVLKGVADVTVLELDPALAIDPADAFLSEHLLQELVEVRVARENDVARHVPRVAFRVLEAGGEAADPAGPLEQLEVFHAALAKPVGRAEAGRAASEDRDP